MCFLYLYPLFGGHVKKNKLMPYHANMMMNRPRRRRRAGQTYGRRVRRRQLVPRQRGFMRVGGYYGRYAGAYGMGAGKYGQRPELKFLDKSTIQTIPAAGLIHELSINLIPQGVTESQRVGRKCTIKSVHARIQIEIPSATDPIDASDTLRVIIYLDKQANGATAAVADILEVIDYTSYFNLENSSRFLILHNKFIPINATAAAIGVGALGFTSNRGQLFYQWSKRCNIPIEFSGVTGAIGEVRSNNIGILAISEGGEVRLETRTRVRFSDN